ncbi:MAG TPA: cobalamin biosynthesis protein [Deltaproteobacteria bacterium]|nr:cobalamin biosynthesis protein [Deltaproteobacteria bacterium]
MAVTKKLWIGLVVLALLAPLGLIVPSVFNAEDAWGEWGTDTLQKVLGYVPERLKQTADLWKAPVPDYNFGSEDASLGAQSGSYILSALIGIGLAGGIVFGLAKMLVKKE